MKENGFLDAFTGAVLLVKAYRFCLYGIIDALCLGILENMGVNIVETSNSRRH